MIKYSLICADEHAFASWFRSSADFDEQVRRALIECPVCQSTRVAKSVMAPSVVRRDGGTASSPPVSPGGGNGKGQSVALLDDSATRVRSALRELRDRIIENSTDVGPDFAEQARRMHEGDMPSRSIRGVTTPDEAKELVESGVPILPIPTLPDEQN